MEDIHESVYKFIEAVGTSEISWEDAVKNLVKKTAESVEDIRIVEVKEMDVKVENQEVVLYRVRVKISFKLKGED